MSKERVSDLLDLGVRIVITGILCFLAGSVIYLGYLDITGKIDTDYFTGVVRQVK